MKHDVNKNHEINKEIENAFQRGQPLITLMRFFLMILTNLRTYMHLINEIKRQKCCISKGRI
jgi:hypothetical protein